MTPYFISKKYFLCDSYTCGDNTLLHLKEIFLVGFLYMWWSHLTSSQKNISCGILIHVVIIPYFISEKYFLWDSYTCGDNTLLHLRKIFLVGFLYMWWCHLTSSQRNISCVIPIHVVMSPYFISKKYFLCDSYTCGDNTLLHLRKIFLVGFLYMWW